MQAEVEEKAAAHYKRAVELQGNEQFEEAIVTFSKAIFLAPDEARFYRGRGEAYLGLCDFKSATSNLHKAVALDTEDAATRGLLSHVLAALGHERLLKQQHEAAVALLGQAIALDGYESAPYAHRALAHVALRAWQAALDDMNVAIRLDHGNADLYVLRGKLHWKREQQREGNEDFKRAHELDPAHPEVQVFEQMMWEQADQAYQGASNCLLQGRHDEAVELLTSALELNPGDVKVLVLRAAAKRQQGTDEAFEAALEDLEEAKALYCYNQAQMSAAGDAGGANADGDAEVLEHPEITRQRNLTWNDMAVRLYQLGDFDGALTRFNRVIASEREMALVYEGATLDARFFVNRGDCYRAMGGGATHMEAALEDYRRALDLLPGNRDVKTRVALVQHASGTQLFNLGRYAEAAIEFGAAIAHDPSVATFYVHRGNALYYQGKYDGAHEQYRAALRVDPRHAEAQQRIAEFRQSEADASAGARAREQAAAHHAAGGGVAGAGHAAARAVSSALPPRLAAAATRRLHADAKLQRVYKQRPDFAPRSLEEGKPRPQKLPPWKETDHLNPVVGGRNFGKGKS
eukprot:g309.t1